MSKELEFGGSRQYFQEVARASEAFYENPDLDKFIEELFYAWRRGNTIYIMGNGGSNNTSVHFAADLLNINQKVPGITPKFRAKSLCENEAFVSAAINDRGFPIIFSEQLDIFFNPGDVVIAISVHGGSGSDKAGTWSQNLPLALQYAKDHSGRALGITGFDGGLMATLCDVNVNVPIESTEIVESMHVAIHHYVKSALVKRISEWQLSQNRYQVVATI